VGRVQCGSDGHCPREMRDWIPASGLGRGQAVRLGTLDPAFGGSNPPAPAIVPSGRECVMLQHASAGKERDIYGG
jgi:hypothetical protein